MRFWLAAVTAAGQLVLAGCEPPPVAAPVTPPPQPAPKVAPAPLASEAGPWGTFHSERFEMQLALPDGRAWRIDDHHGPWLSATHAAWESMLVVRSWTEDGRATRQRCEEQARLWRAFPDPARGEQVKANSIDAPAGFDTFVSVGLVPGKPGEAVSGFALAFGGRGHRCFAWAFTTTARGEGAALLLGDRLSLMERALSKVVLASEVAPQVPRERPEVLDQRGPPGVR